MTRWRVDIDAHAARGLADAVAARTGRVHLIEGPVGIGKSALADAVTTLLAADGFRILPVLCLPELQAVPLGAMAPVLAEDAGSVESRLPRLLAALAPRRTRAVLLVDDAAWLDDLSAAAVHQLVRAYRIHCVMTARDHAALPSPIRRLEDEGLVERHRARPLSAQEVDERTAATLGGRVEPESLRRLRLRVAGNPLFLRLLLEAAERQGAVGRSESGLLVVDPQLTDRIVELAEQRHAALSVEQLDLAELVAAAPGLPAELIAGPGSRAALASLERGGLVTCDADGAMHPAQPLFAEALLATMPQEVLERHRRNAALLLAATAQDEHRLAAAALRAASTEPPPLEELAWAAAQANAREDYALALLLAARAESSAADSDAAVPTEALLAKANSLSFLGRLDDADAAFDAALATAADGEALSLIAVRAGLHHAVRRQDPAAAISLAEQVLARITDAAARTRLDSHLARWRLLIGLGPASAPAAPASSAEPGPALEAQLLRVLVGAFAGQLPAVREAIAEARPLADQVRAIHPRASTILDAGEFMILLFDAGPVAAFEHAERVRGIELDEATGVWDFLSAMALQQAGRLREAQSYAEQAVERLAWRDFLGARGAAVGLHAAIASRLGRPGVAASVLRTIEAGGRGIVATALFEAEAEALILVAGGDPDAAIGRLADVVPEAIAHGYPTIGALAAHTAVRFGRASQALPWLRAAADAPAPNLRLLLAHAEALVDGEPLRVLEAAGALAVAGFHAGAHDAAVQSLALATDRGDRLVAKRAAVAASRIATQLEPPPDRSETAALLSPREYEVARSAAARMRSQEIADRLGLSVRTVENHLQRAYRKLGVSSRDELREILG